MRRLLISIFIVLTGCFTQGVYAQALPAESDFTGQITEAFLNHYKHGGLQEKLYLVTDKPYYSAGETVWFSAFVLNSLFFTRFTESSFIYVELVSGEGGLVTRLKVKGENGRFDNCMELPAKLAAGRYTLRAYTKWMTNFDDSFLFRKEIEIANPIDDAVQPRITYTINNDRSVAARIAFETDAGEPIVSCPVEYSLHINGKTNSYASKTNEKGVLSFKFKPSLDAGDCLSFRIEANNRILDRTVPLPTFSDDFALQFMPEGGNLIAGLSQIVAFKATGVDGASADVEGYVSNASGERICDISSRHAGMGMFIFTAYEGVKYTATVTSSRGVTRTFALPAAQPSGCALHVKRSAGNSLLIRLQTTDDLPLDRLAIVVQVRGKAECVVENPARINRLPLDKMQSGVAQISVIDKPSKRVIAERLFFVNNRKFASADIAANTSEFAPHQKITLDIDVRNSDGNPVEGDFVVSVTDAAVVRDDNGGDNIFSYLLLTSDLRGRIENPTYYFESDDAVRADNLDLVMLTHGWRRYSLESLLAGKCNEIRYPVESTQRITGYVTGIVGKAKSPSLLIMEKKSRYSGLFELTESNNFIITGLDVPDTAYYYIQALNRRGHSRAVRIRVDPDTYPPTNAGLYRPHFKSLTSSVPENFLMRSKESYYNDGGMRIIDIEEVVVTAQRVENYSYSSVVDSFNTLRGLSNYASIYDALQRFRKLNVSGTNVTVRRERRNFVEIGDMMGDTDADMADEEEAVPAVYINGMSADVNSLDLYSLEDVKSLSYVDAADAIFLGAEAKYGAIIMEVKEMRNAVTSENETMAKVLVPGYCKPVEFFAPCYDRPDPDRKKDIRSTIAWEPRLRSGADGKARVTFWSADRRNDYNVVLEGITSEGELCRATARLTAEK